MNGAMASHYLSQVLWLGASPHSEEGDLKRCGSAEEVTLGCVHHDYWYNIDESQVIVQVEKYRQRRTHALVSFT